MSLKELLETEVILPEIIKPIPLSNKEFNELIYILYDYDKRWKFYQLFKNVEFIDNSVKHSFVKYLVDLNDQELYNEVYYYISLKIEYDQLIEILINLYKQAKTDRGKILVLNQIHSFNPSGTFIWQDGLAAFDMISNGKFDNGSFRQYAIHDMKIMEDKERKYNNALIKKYNFLIEEALITHEDNPKFLVLCEKIVDDPSFYPQLLKDKISQLLKRNKQYAYKYHISYADKYSF